MKAIKKENQVSVVQLFDNANSIKEAQMLINDLSTMNTGDGGNNALSDKWHEYCSGVSNDGGMNVVTLERKIFVSFGHYLVKDSDSNFSTHTRLEFEKLYSNSANENKVFLGGTCGEACWREMLIPLINVDYFNPVVENWTSEMQLIEQQQKKECNIHLYVITCEMKGFFSIAEMIDSAHSDQKKTIVQIIPEGFSPAQIKSFEAIVDMVNNLGGNAFINSAFIKLADIINSI